MNGQPEDRFQTLATSNHDALRCTGATTRIFNRCHWPSGAKLFGWRNDDRFERRHDRFHDRLGTATVVGIAGSIES